VDQQIDPTTGHLSTVSTQPGLSTSTTATASANSLPNNPFTQQLPPYPLQTLHQRPLSIPLPPALYASSASSNTTSTNDNSTYNGIYHTSVLKQQNIPLYILDDWDQLDETKLNYSDFNFQLDTPLLNFNTFAILLYNNKINNVV
jgi:hypothetical protein